MLLALLVLGIYGRFRDVVVEQTRRQLLISATEQARHFDHFVRDHVTSLQMVLGNPLVVRELTAEAGEWQMTEMLLSEMLRSRPSVVGVELFGPDLEFLYRVPTWLPDARLADSAGLSEVFREGRPLVRDGVIWLDGAPHLIIAVPVLTPSQGQPLAVARMPIRLEAALSRYLIPAGAEGSAWMIARDGTMVWHPLQSKIGKPMLTYRDELAPEADLTSLTAILMDMRAGNAGSGIYEFARSGNPHEPMLKIAGYAPLASVGGALSVAVALEYDQIAGPIRQYGLRVGLLGAAILALLAIGIVFYLRMVKQAQRLQRESLEQLNHVLSVSPAALYHLKRGPSGELELAFMSASMNRAFGYTAAEWLQGPQWWTERIHPDDLPSIREAWKKLAEQGLAEHSFRFRHSDGHYRWVRDAARLLRDSDGRVDELVGSWLDVTETRQAEERQRLADRLFDNAIEGAFITDAERRMLRVNAALVRMTGFTAEEMLGQQPQALRPEYQSSDLVTTIEQSLASEGSWSGELQMRRKNGEFFPARVSLSTVLDATGKLSNYAALVTDLSAQRELEQTVLRLSHYDPVTGLPNRMLLMEHLAQELNEAAHRKERLALLFVDIDNFKQINETLGRSVGDRILRHIGTRLQYGLEASAILTQPGGDQFVAILPALRNGCHADGVAADVVRLIGEPMELDNLKLDISASVGISLYPDDAEDAVDLLHNAEAAMYHVKNGGGAGYHFFTNDLNERATRRLKLLQALRDAVARDELRLAYQPQMELTSGRIVGVEALLRWEHRELGMISPAEFVPLAEESGLIVPIGEWVLREACRQAAMWQSHGPLRVGVNLSLRQFQTGTLKQTVESVLAESGLQPSLLELEITESLAMADPVGTTETLDSLRELGVRLALDDFGTGYSSLSYLQRLPLDTLKVDRTFIEHLETKADDLVLTSTIISMAHALGLSVIAEGVETFRQLEILRERRCDEIQGYFLSRPLYAADLDIWFRQHRQRLASQPKGGELV